MICIVVAQNVMCLYVQMCVSILRVFITFSVMMVGWLSVCWLLVCCIVFFSFFFSSHHKTCYLPLSSRQGIDYLLRISNMKYTFNNCYFTNVEWHDNLLQGWTGCMHGICTRNVFHTKEQVLKGRHGNVCGGIWMNFKQSDLPGHSDACCSALPVNYRPSIDPSKTKHTAFPFSLPDKRIQQSIFCPVTSNPPQRSDGISLVASTSQGDWEGWWERGWEEKRRRGREVIAVVVQWLWRRLDDWVHL